MGTERTGYWGYLCRWFMRAGRDWWADLKKWEVIPSLIMAVLGFAYFHSLATRNQITDYIVQAIGSALSSTTWYAFRFVCTFISAPARMEADMIAEHRREIDAQNVRIEALEDRLGNKESADQRRERRHRAAKILAELLTETQTLRNQLFLSNFGTLHNLWKQKVLVGLQDGFPESVASFDAISGMHEVRQDTISGPAPYWAVILEAEIEEIKAILASLRSGVGS